MNRVRRIGIRIAALAVLATTLIGILAASGPSQEARPEVTGPEKVVQEQVEAYNRHDIEAFAKTYSSDHKRYVFPDQEMGTGLESLRTTYGKLFAENPKLKVKIAKRIVQGEYVIDQEEVSTGTRDFTAVAIYRVKDGKIVEVRFVK
jgi:hypothetical protein